jgi:hypothetical protein
VLSRRARRILQLTDEFHAGTRRPSPATVEMARRILARADEMRRAERVRATVREIARLAGATLRR